MEFRRVLFRSGIAAALSLAEHFADDGPICVILGDNIIQGNIRAAADDYRRQGRGAKILLKRVPDPQRFGVPELDGQRVLRIEEKPRQPKSEYAVIGIYMYDGRVFDTIRTLKPSGRDELEGWWTDAGTCESLLRASNLVAETGANNEVVKHAEAGTNA